MASKAVDTAFAEALEDPKVAAAAAEVMASLGRGNVNLAEIGGFSQQEMDGGHAAAVRMLEAGHAAKALQIAGSLILLSPNAPAYHRLAAVSLHHLGEYALADAYYRSAQRLDPGDPATMLYRGEVLLALGDEERGAKELRRGLAAAGKDPALGAIVKRAIEVARAHALEM